MAKSITRRNTAQRSGTDRTAAGLRRAEALTHGLHAWSPAAHRYTNRRARADRNACRGRTRDENPDDRD